MHHAHAPTIAMTDNQTGVQRMVYGNRCAHRNPHKQRLSKIMVDALAPYIERICGLAIDLFTNSLRSHCSYAFATAKAVTSVHRYLNRIMYMANTP